MDFIYEVGQHLDIGNFHGTIIDNFRKNGSKYCKYKCDACGYEGEKIEISITNGVGCTCCDNKVVVQGINDIPTTDPWMIPYFQGGKEEASQYTKSSGKKIIPICPDCGRIKDIPMKINNIYSRKGIACVCGDGITFPNKFIYGLMEQLLDLDEIATFTREFRIKDKLFDMYFISKNNKEYIIEMDGGFNHGKVILNHGRYPKTLDHYINDEIKNDIAYEAGIDIIRIDCYKSDFQYIKSNIIDSNLNLIVDLSKIDWNKLLEFCSSNIVKKVCEYRNEHPDLFSQQIGDIFHISSSTVRKYWKMGAELGWCVFDSKEEMKRRNTYEHNHTNCRQIMIENIDTNETYSFKSMSEFVRNSSQYNISITKSILEKRLLKSNPIKNYQGFNIYKI